MTKASLFGCLAAIAAATCGAGRSDSEVTNWRQSPPLGVAVGDLVFRRDNGLWTSLFVNMSTREKRFSHVGIVDSVDSNRVDIIHADAHETTGVGCVRVERWEGFFSESLEGAVYRFNGESSVARRFAVEGRKLLGVPFDSAFDLSTTNRLYCTEFVSIVVNSSAGRDIIDKTSTGDKEFIAIDDVYKHGFSKIWDSTNAVLGAATNIR